MKNEYIEQIINDSKYTYYAHTKEDSNEGELLSSHLNLTYSYYEKMEKYKNLNIKIPNMIRATFRSSEELTNEIYELFKMATYYHDIGKINPLFQKNKMNNDLHIKVENNDSTHAALSARMYIDYMQKLFDERIHDTNGKITVYYVIYYFAYIISRHHSNLEDITELQDSISKKNIPQIINSRDNVYEMHLGKINEFFKRINPDPIGLYILCKTLYSCMVIADFYATYEYMTGNTVPVDSKKDEGLFSKYNKSDLLKVIRKYQNKDIDIEGINKLRSDLFIETEHNLMNNMDNNIFYIEAPTGAGKTNLAINIARILYENNDDIKSVQYIFPFNTIIEQTATTFDSYFEKYKEYMVINSISSMVQDVKENLDFESVYMKNAFRQFPIIITSHVNLFNSLFGSGKESNYSLYHLVDSVIVIDEIQAYSNKIWREMIILFSKYSSLLNIKFVIMSATLPRLDKLLNEPIAKFCSLVEDTKKYYQNDIFKNRVELNFDLLDKKITLDELAKKIIEYKDKKVLVECIKKETADKLYSVLSVIDDVNVQILTGDDNKFKRNEVIKMSKDSKALIIVATQTIEAGVDIDMDIGFKDISFIDGDEQFLGRINRSSKKKDCIAYFFNLDDARLIYREDNRLEYSLEKDEVRGWLANKEFDKFYNKVLEKILDKTEQYNNQNIQKFYNSCNIIDYKEVQKRMQLINTDVIQLFLNYEIECDGNIIRGSDVFNEYKSIYLNKDLGYAEKKIKLSKVSEKLNLFIYSIYKGKGITITGEEFGNLYYVENGADFVESGRFNRAKYLGEGDGLFL